MKRIAILLVLIAAMSCGCIGEDEETELTIYTYDSFVAEWGPGPLVIPMFEEMYGVDVNIISIGSSGDMIARAIAEKDDPQADVLLGINDLQMYRAFSNDLLEEYRPNGYEMIAEDLVMDDQWRLTPFDYGHMALIYDSDVIDSPPASFEALKDPKWNDKLIVEDPRTSSPGMSFLLWTIAAYGDDFSGYWSEINDSILTVAPSWSTAYYGMFIEGEAPMVISYSTSPAYHLEYEDTDRYKGVIFEEGGFLQIEGAGVVKDANNPKLAKKFIDFMLTEEFQAELPLTQFMMPVNPNVELPESYKQIVEVSEDILPLDRSLIESELDTWLDEWLEAIG